MQEINVNDLKHFIDVSANQNFQQSKPLIPSVIKNLNDILPTLENYWKGLNYLSDYKAGSITGSIARSNNLLMFDFFKNLPKLYEEIVRNELSGKSLTSEGFLDDFKAFQFMMNVMLNHLAIHLKESDNIKFAAFLQGYINSLIQAK